MPSAQPRDEAPARSWWTSPWLWTVVVVVVVAGALAVSFLASSSPTPDGDDVSAFCPAVQTYWRDTALLTNLDLSLPPSTYDTVLADVAQMRATAPASIASDVDVVADGVEQLARKLQVIAARAPGDRGVEAIEEAGQAVQSASRGRDRSVTRLAEYVRSACGFDLTSPPDVPATASTTVPPPSPTSVGPPGPSSSEPSASLVPDGLAPSGPTTTAGPAAPGG